MFGKNIMVMEDYDGGLQLSNVPLCSTSFKIRMYDLLLGCMNARTVCKIADSLGYIEDVDLHDNSQGWDEFAWVRISLDITTSLSREKQVNVGEYLSSFYY